MLRKIRIILAALFFAGITLLFLDVTGTIHQWLGWMAKIQFLPAALALNFAVVAVLLILTLLFGRVYCSVICPLGIMQDIFSWIRGKFRKKDRFRFTYSPARNWLRYRYHGKHGLCKCCSFSSRCTKNQFDNSFLQWISHN